MLVLTKVRISSINLTKIVNHIRVFFCIVYIDLPQQHNNTAFPAILAVQTGGWFDQSCAVCSIEVFSMIAVLFFYHLSGLYICKPNHRKLCLRRTSVTQVSHQFFIRTPSSHNRFNSSSFF